MSLLPKPADPIFRWQPWYETGIASVDAQHLQLVGLLNDLEGRLTAGTAFDPQACLETVGALCAYALRHFREESGLMLAAGVDPLHAEPHLAKHEQFVRQVSALRDEAREDDHPDLAGLAHFVTAWLTQHILGVDQSMARQMRAIAAGCSPAEAYALEARPADPASGALLGAVSHLHDLLSARNADLAEANQALEARVAERTAELERANADLRGALAQIQLAQGQLLESEKMAAVGQLAGGVAHEINNPLGFLSSNLGFLSEELSGLAGRQLSARQVDELLEVLGECRTGASRVRDIVRSLREFAGPEGTAWQFANLETGLDSGLRVLRGNLKAGTEVRRTYGGIPPVECLPGGLNRVFLNLMLNAGQALADQGHITLRTGLGVEGEVWVEVQDDGCGMSPETMKRAFEPFFTTREVGKGKGLGLSTAYAIVQQHHGRLELSSELGRGTCVRVVLPLRQPAPPT